MANYWERDSKREREKDSEDTEREKNREDRERGKDKERMRVVGG